MADFKVGDIIVTRGRIPVHSTGEKNVLPWVYGKLIFVHPTHRHCTFFNGDYNQGAWIDDIYLASEWEKGIHSPAIPVIKNI